MKELTRRVMHTLESIDERLKNIEKYIADNSANSAPKVKVPVMPLSEAGLSYQQDKVSTRPISSLSEQVKIDE